MPVENEYVLSRGSEEYERLRKQSLMWESATRRVLLDVGIPRGARCLDAGCGPGEVMRLMGEIAGDDADIVGLDSDARLGAEAVTMLRRGSGARFHFVEADVTAHAFAEAERFDVTYARLLLIHMADPAAVLRRLMAWTKPGGTVVLQDYDLTAAKIHPALETWPDFQNVILGAFERRGRDPAIGVKLPTLLREAGVGGPIGTDVTGKLTSLQEGAPMLMGVFRGLLPQALSLGLIDEAAAARVLEEIDEKSRGDQPCTVCWPILGAAWARV